MSKNTGNWARAAIAACALTILCSSMGQAQPDTLWTSGIRNAGSYLQVIRTDDGGYAVGTSGWAGDEDRRDQDFQLMKLDSLGNLEWRQFYAGIYNNGHGADYGFTVAQTLDGGYVMGGRRHGGVLIRTDEVGDTLWMRYYRSDDGFQTPMTGAMKCRITPDRNIVFNARQMVVKVDDENGDVIWHQVYEDCFDLSEILCIEEDEFLIGGRTRSFGAGADDVYVAKLDSEGNVEWQEAYGTEDGEYCNGLIATTDGGYCLVGGSRSDEDRYAAPYIVRIDADGELLWHHIYDDYRGSYPEDVVETADGGFAVASYSSFYFLSRYDYSGEELWRTTYGYHWQPRICGEAYSLHLMEDGGYLLGGFSGNLGLWLVRTEPDPVDLPFELEIEVDEHDFGEVTLDSVVAWEFEMRNTGRRYVVIDSLWFEGDTSAFACPLDLPFRIDPEDTSFVPVLFQPLADTTYNTTLILPYGNEQTLEITLSGRGFLQSAPEEPNILREFVLQGVFPNPFNSVTAIRFALPEPAFTRLTVFDITGRQVASVIDVELKAGRYMVEFDAGGLSSGIYLVRLEAEDNTAFIKMALVK